MHETMILLSPNTVRIGNELSFFSEVFESSSVFLDSGQMMMRRH